MNIYLIFTIIIVGLSGIVAQILLLRELLVSFSGNELTIGIVLANWVISEALGVYLFGRLVDRMRNKFNAFICLQLIFSLLLPLTLYLSRTFKVLLGVPFAESIGLNLIYLCSFLVVLPVSFAHGALFAVCSKLFALKTEESAGALGRVYTWEMGGTILGGLILTYLFIPYFNAFQTVFFISFVNLLLILAYLKNISSKILKSFSVISLCLMVFISAIGGISYLQRASIKKHWKTMEVLDYQNSVYGNVVVTKQLKQYTFYYNGIPVITTPFPDLNFVQELGNLPLLFHQAPKNVLVISSGAGGLINEILKHPVEKIDYAEIDPLIIKMLKEYPTALSNRELSDKRVNIFNTDGRYFLRTQPGRYDLILIGFSKQSDLSTNRIFTEEFFRLVKSRLNPDGVFAYWVPGSLTYLSQELKDLNSCILNALRNNFSYVRIIPEDFNIYLASSKRDIMAVTPAIISQRMQERGVKADILLPKYIEYRLDKKWLDWFNNSMLGSTKSVNRDYHPVAVYQMLLFWNKQFSPVFFSFLEACKKLDLRITIALISLLTLSVIYAIRRSGQRRLAVSFSIATTGFFGMLMTVILSLCFQIFYGYLYYRIGLLVSIFMAGAAAGSLLMTSRIEQIKDEIRCYLATEISIIAFCILTGLIITRYPALLSSSSVFFSVFFLISGLLMGLQFPLASKIYMGKKSGAGEASGVLYGSDLLGGWVAGALGSVILVPVLGLSNACLVMVILKTASLIVFSLNCKKI